MLGVVAAGYVPSGGSTLISDAFNRADNSSSLGSADIGGAWTALSGTWGISSNTARNFSAGNQSFATIDAAAADGTATLTIASGPGSGGGICFRASDVNNLWFVECASGQTILYQVNAGSYSGIITGMATFANGDVMSVVLAGTSITVKKNGATIGSTTSSFNQSATKHGLRDYGGAIRLDGFSFVG